MIDIIGHLWIDEKKPERIKALLASLKSFEFIKTHCRIILNLEHASESLLKRTDDLLKECQFDYSLTTMSGPTYGEVYMHLLAKGNNDFVLNFIEDHFMVLDDAGDLAEILQVMRDTRCDILKGTFFQVEQNSSRTLNIRYSFRYGRVYDNNPSNHEEYQKYYGKRFYIGVNFITTRAFAEKFWNRKLKRRPHEYEVATFDPQWFHIAMIPDIPIMDSIDDDHGEPGSCLLKRDEPKFRKIYDGIN